MKAEDRSPKTGVRSFNFRLPTPDSRLPTSDLTNINN